MPTLAVALLPTHLIPASAGLLMAALSWGDVSALMVSWALLAHLVLVPALTIRPVVTSALAAVLWLAMMEGVGAAWWPAVVHAAWWLAAV